MPVFEIYDDQKPRCLRIETARMTIGRTAENLIIVDDRNASRIHCEIRNSHGHFVLRDLASRNGTILNNDSLDRPVVLQDGDEILIGQATVRFWSNKQKLSSTARKLPLIDQTKKKKMKKGISAREVYKKTGKIPTAVSMAKEAKLAKSAKPDKVTKAKKPAKKSRKPSRPQPAIPMEAAEEEGVILPDIKLSHENSVAKKQVVNLSSMPEVLASDLTLNHVIPLNSEGKAAHTSDKDASEVSVAMLRLKQLLLRAFQFAATDIHVEPKEDQIQLRYRIDGYLHSYGTLDLEVVNSVYSIVKLLCNLDITKRSVMVDGSFAVQLPNRRVDLRVSIAPTTMGDKMVIRILDKNLAPQDLVDLGMDEVIYEQVRKLAKHESSMMVVCGPTGSGKTTTVYAILQEMNHVDKNIVTVEDPVEYKLENVTQIQVNQKMGVTFGAALTSLLRQDPDIILVGEMRDPETAQMAVQSAMTGHLVLSTLHARDSISSIFRFLDLGVEPFMLGSALTAVLSQRLLRRLCDHCKMRVQHSAKKLSDLGLSELTRHKLYSQVGCKQCMEIGYHGRIPIFEMLNINDHVREAITQKPSIQQLRTAAGDWIFQTLREDAIRKLRNGQTTLEEFAAIIGSREG